MLLRLCSLVMVLTILALSIQLINADMSSGRRAIHDPFEFDLYDEPLEDSEDAFNRMESLCARLHKRNSLQASPLLYRLCSLLK
ncbi:hypothetical protein KIN20_007372 [Parelaphostrongylus tenuis]|uniref:Uncharacterized protein n=1 Tax=Parelaphostrongylus tenuis TaxID=148309 RepID=A0AAD5MLE8_PARTN|nr:hypothetical protein KIN20_007372 [Parelaphostrongylus tenuis]